MRSPNPIERLAAALLIPHALAKRMRFLDDRQIAELLDDEVCSNLNVLAPESTICLAAADRLRRHTTASTKYKGFGIRRRARSSWAAIRDDGKHIMHAEAALYRAGVPFLQLPWQRNRFASDTFMVMNIAEACACLLRAGFRETLRSPTLFIDSQTRKPIRLYGDKTQLYSNNGEELSR